MYIYMYGMKTKLRAEFACWWLAYKVTNTSTSKMQHGLPTSDGLPMTPNPNITSTEHISTNPSSTLLINTDTVLSSLGDSLRVHTCTPAGTSHNPVSVDLVVSSTTHSSPVQQFATITSTTPFSGQYNLSEIVSREKDVLFQSYKDPDLELEPARTAMLSVRRRSRQFFTLMEEEEGDSAGKIETAAPLGDANTEGEKSVHIDSVLNLGDSLKQLYFPKKERQKRRGKKKVKEVKVTFGEESGGRACGYASDPGSRLGYESDPGSKLGYESDPGAKLGLCEIISNVPELHSSRSSSDLSQMGDAHVQIDEVFVVGSSKSLPNTPRVSPKLMRRNSKSDLNVEIPHGPGFSFLAGVAGELHLRKLQHEKKLETGLTKVSAGHVVCSPPDSIGHVVSSPPVSMGHIISSPPVSMGHVISSPSVSMGHIISSPPVSMGHVISSPSVSMGHVVSSPPADVIAVVSQPRVEATTAVSLYSGPSTHTHMHHMHDFSDSTGADLESHTPMFVKSFLQWSTKTKVEITSKESNMFSPTSF